MKNSHFKTQNPKPKTRSGFTLTELLVAISITLLLVGTLYTVYTISQSSFKYGLTKIELIQNAKIGLERISRELRETNQITTVLPTTGDDPENPPVNEIAFQDANYYVLGGGYIVSGAINSPTVNGTYIENGTYGGKPSYELVGGDFWIWWYPDQNGWILTVNKGDPARYHYYSNSSGYPDEGDWLTAPLGTDPPPTAIEAPPSNPDIWVAYDTPGVILQLDEEQTIASNITNIEFYGQFIVTINLSAQSGLESVNLTTQITPRNI